MEVDKMHELHHPNVPFVHSDWSETETLHVACAYSNPIRWRTRRHLLNDFRRHMDLPNVKLYVGELAYGERPFEVTHKDHPLDFQWRTRHELWHKENLLNLVIQRFPLDWKYGAWIDGDFTFARRDVALETIHQLQHYDWVQMFSSYSDLGYHHEVQRTMNSFAWSYTNGNLTDKMRVLLYKGSLPYDAKVSVGVGATGGAWAFRREAFDKCGGLLDTCVLGSGDWHMAFGLVGVPDIHPQVREMHECGEAYAESIRVWQDRAARFVRNNVGCVNCHAVHHYHGSKDKRGYDWRWRILQDNVFDPKVDLHRDAQGVYSLTPEKPQLRDAIRRYFRSRDEDR